jgi:hypothetical protein
LYRYLFLWTLLLIITATSCTVSENIVCDPGKLAVYSSGYSQHDMDSAFVVGYNPGQAFATPRDTASVHFSSRGGDTAWLALYRYEAKTPVPFPNGYLEYGADYRLYIPRLNRVYEFTEITLAGREKQTIMHSKRNMKYYTCTNEVVSFKVDGNRTSPSKAELDDAVFIGK